MSKKKKNPEKEPEVVVIKDVVSEKAAELPAKKPNNIGGCGGTTDRAFSSSKKHK